MHRWSGWQCWWSMTCSCCKMADELQHQNHLHDTCSVQHPSSWCYLIRKHWQSLYCIFTWCQTTSGSQYVYHHCESIARTALMLLGCWRRLIFLCKQWLKNGLFSVVRSDGTALRRTVWSFWRPMPYYWTGGKRNPRSVRSSSLTYGVIDTTWNSTPSTTLNTLGEPTIQTR